MKITKQQLTKIIKEEVEKTLMERNFDPKTGEPISDKGWFMAAQNPDSPFHKQAKHKMAMAKQRGDQAAQKKKNQAEREKQNELIKQAMDAEKKCMDWALEDPERKAMIIKHYKEGNKGLPPEVVKSCPHKASEEAQNLLNTVRDRMSRAAKGQAPADDDKSALGNIRRRMHRAKQGLPPADDDNTALGNVRRRMHAKKNK
tara:strand:- start:2924 stop:3526 length:603 start_codon:yes stop_codon:yes gene_type:complete